MLFAVMKFASFEEHSSNTWNSEKLFAEEQKLNNVDLQTFRVMIIL